MSAFDLDDPATHPLVGAWMWHVHHQELAEPLIGTLAGRIAYIKANKPADEIETRLRWMTPVLGTIPDALSKAWATYDKARDAYLPALEALHAVEHPGCPWNGRTIFP